MMMMSAYVFAVAVTLCALCIVALVIVPRPRR